MNYITARNIIKKNKLIGKKDSRDILLFIKKEKKKIDFKFSKKDLKIIKEIRKEYFSIKTKTKILLPRNLPFYLIIKKKNSARNITPFF